MSECTQNVDYNAESNNTVHQNYPGRWSINCDGYLNGHFESLFNFLPELSFPNMFG